ncbi:MAG: CDGSH iron-sulfur domain-containing protein [Methanomicrobiales archaeon]|jgi:CDGSH-type Zn-finger protein
MNREGEEKGEGTAPAKPSWEEIQKYGQRIRVCKNGPYQVFGGIPLSVQRIVLDKDGFSSEWREEEKFPVQDQYILCRCGRSGTRPFCDGIHKEIFFMGTEHASREPYISQSKEYAGPDLVLTDAEILCSVAKFCERAGGIWKLTLESANKEAREIAIREAAACPSGRLVVWDKMTQTPIEPKFEPSIGLVEYPPGRFERPGLGQGRHPHHLR